ncbi:MAG: hypothetical protein KGL02_02675 [Acidobacteriota bacterium]|nr:hypothetical protein [Acidobacteriota bacterium]MDE3169280.1 hypothetical protein [Acidobacteriota bacterium]
MPYRPRELVVRAREAAGLLLAALDRDEMVARFLDVYAAEHRRPGRADHPYLYREQLSRIRREAILAMVLRIEAALPARLKVSVAVRTTQRRGAARRGKASSRAAKHKRQPNLELAIPFLDLFREEFFVALGQAMRWTEEDAKEFWRDLELYERLSVHASRGSTAGSRRSPASGPFVDRVGLLLDPSMMEQARRDAGKFELELQRAADRVLRVVFSRRRSN